MARRVRRSGCARVPGGVGCAPRGRRRSDVARSTRRAPLDERHRVDDDAFAPPGAVHAFVGLALDADRARAARRARARARLASPRRAARSSAARTPRRRPRCRRDSRPRAHARPPRAASSGCRRPSSATSESGNSLPMSPRFAAPSTASVIAWDTASASEWPVSPRSCGMRTPPRTRSRPSANRCESYPKPTLVDGPIEFLLAPRRSGPSRAWRGPWFAGQRRDGLRDRQVLGRGHLDVVGVAVDEDDRVPGRLGQRGLVRGLAPRAPQRHRLGKHLAPEPLRASARGRRCRAGWSPRSARPRATGRPRFTVSRAGSAAMAAPCSAAAAMTRSITSGDANGRAASWTSTTSTPPSTRSNPAATESCRRAPPAVTRTFDTSSSRTPPPRRTAPASPR